MGTDIIAKLKQHGAVPGRVWLQDAVTYVDLLAGTGRVAKFMIGKANPIVVADLSSKMLSEARQKDGLLPCAGYLLIRQAFLDFRQKFSQGVSPFQSRVGSVFL